jgi:hypothetical protein
MQLHHKLQTLVDKVNAQGRSDVGSAKTNTRDVQEMSPNPKSTEKTPLVGMIGSAFVAGWTRTHSLRVMSPTNSTHRRKECRFPTGSAATYLGDGIILMLDGGVYGEAMGL